MMTQKPIFTKKDKDKDKDKNRKIADTGYLAEGQVSVTKSNSY